MKLIKKLKIDGRDVPLINESAWLDIDRPGRAMFTVESPEPLTGTVLFAMGWNFEEDLTLVFTGEVYESTKVDELQYKVFCREISARLDACLPMAMRHPTLKDVLLAYSAQAGLLFNVPQKPYANTKVPAFYATGSGFAGLASLGQVFNIPDYVWLNQANGEIFVGSWQDSIWAGQELYMPENLFTNVRAGGVKTVMAVPQLRPGCVLNGQRVKSVIFSGHNMEITPCKTA